MRSSMKLGKHVEDSRSGGCLDRISSLPDELLGHILSFLPTRCAVSTSILSKKWQYLFTLTTSFSFDDAPCFGGSEVYKDIETVNNIRFKKFVYRVLEMHQISPIKKFSLVCRGTYDKSDLRAWVSNAVQKGVQEIHYHVGDQKDLLPDALFMCDTLVRLEIIGGDYELEIPLSAWLPNVKILHLEYVIFSDFDTVGRLFSSCELLEELSLKFCESDTDYHVILSTGLLKVLTIEDCSFEEGLFEIDAPNLAYLTYSSNIGVKIVPSWKNSCSLVKAELKFNYCSDDDSNYNSLQYDRRLIKAAACKATKLYLLSDSVELLLTLADHEQMPDFHSLSSLHLCYCPYYAWKYVTSLLDKSPQLETVIFQWGLHRCYCDPVSPSGVPLTPFSCHVKVIVVHSFCTHELALLLLGHLLRNTRVLKRVIVHTCSSVNTEEELRISKDLLMLPRASTDCCIELK